MSGRLPPKLRALLLGGANLFARRKSASNQTAQELHVICLPFVRAGLQCVQSQQRSLDCPARQLASQQDTAIEWGLRQMSREPTHRHWHQSGSHLDVVVNQPLCWCISTVYWRAWCDSVGIER
ncbi:hypothetical protein DL89DRAFT_159405 [Linderina pennispora]|uniref:Uncharacterized protein n=1 Tax=Linderina pennispora TaxID=61395 RepID=A0A1Y1VTZ9_9FUNG|nr:uncharacterized protein DL89DRAFT_159405 [Linderina pennispora]ORX64760.1 hypothetical protein DL89DRAFT_159405 [Linderina pennispora]